MKKEETNYELIDLITPVGGLEFERNKVYFGNRFCKVYTIAHYPSNVEMKWLGNLVNNIGAIFSINIEPTDNTELIDNLDSRIRDASGLAKIAKNESSRQLKEKEIIALESPRNEAERAYLMRNVYADFDALVESIKARIEAMRMEIVATGKVTLDENNLDAAIDFGVPAENKAANVDWSAETSNPINDMITWKNQLDTAPARVLTSTTVLSKILANKNVVNALFGKDSARIKQLLITTRITKNIYI